MLLRTFLVSPESIKVTFPCDGLKCFCLLMSLFFAVDVFATNYTSSQAGDWSNSATWGGAGVPAQGDNVTIAHAITVNSNTSVTNATVNAGSITISSGIILKVFGNWNNSVAFTMSSGTVEFANSSSANLSGSAAKNFYDVIIDNGATISLNTNQAVNVANNLTNNGTFNVSSGASGTFSASITGTFTNNGSFNFVPSGATGVSLTIGNIINNSGATLATKTATGSNTIDITGNWTNNGTYTPNNSTVTLKGASSIISGASSFYNLAYNKSGGTLTFDVSSITQISNSFNTTAGSSTGSNNALVEFTGAASTVTGTIAGFYNLQIDNGATLTASTDITLAGNFTNNGSFNAGTQSVKFSNSSSTGITHTLTGNTTFYDLQLSSSSNTLSITASLTKILHGLSNSGGSMQPGTGTIEFVSTSSLSGSTQKVFYDIQIDNGATVTLSGSTVSIGHNFINNGTFTANAGHTVTFNGGITQTLSGTGTTTFDDLTIGSTSFGSSSTTFNASQNFTIAGSNFKFNAPIGQTATFNGSNTVTITTAATITKSSSGEAAINFNNLTTNGNITEGANITVSGQLNLGSSSTFTIGANTLTLNGSLSGSGTFTGSSSSNLSIGGSSGGSLGTLSFTSGQETLNSFSINRTGSNANVILGSNLSVASLTLTNGVVATGDHLFTFLNANGDGSALAVAGYTQNSTAYKNSYICTCDATGTPITTTDGTKGFRISNVGSTEIMFPVGANFVSPNRMSMKNEGPVDDYTVVVQIGDIGKTPMPVIYRKWYINEKTPPATSTDSSLVSMKLYFTKQDQTMFLSGQDEVETGFDYTDMHLVYKATSTYFSHVANYGDMLNSNQAAYSLGTEMYGQYTKGVSIADGNRSVGLTRFGNLFGVVNQGTYILPVRFISFTAEQKKASVLLNWVTANDQDIDRYEIEYAGAGQSFTKIGTIKVSEKNKTGNYTWLHLNPSSRNLYRIKSVDRNGKIFYSSALLVSLKMENNSFIKVSPNPVADHIIHIHFSNALPGAYMISLFNADGKEVFRQTTEYLGYESDCLLKLPMTIAPGVYFLKTSNGGQLVTDKIVVQ